jgi:UDP-glucose 4-epimerase
VIYDVGNAAALRNVFQQHDIDAVIHFAGSIVVPESVANPLEYYRNNTAATRNLVAAACVEHGVHRFVFSSTAAVYGIPAEVPIAETAPTIPINPYCRSKLVSEWILADTAHAHDFRYVTLRYFNVAGADPKGRSGQSTPRATHLIKRACKAAVGREHLLALDRLRAGGEPLCANVGYGHGFSVLEVIAAGERAAGRRLNTIRSAPRNGDPPALIADPTLVKSFGWQPKYNDLDMIVRSALAWEIACQTAGRTG